MARLRRCSATQDLRRVEMQRPSRVITAQPRSTRPGLTRGTSRLRRASAARQRLRRLRRLGRRASGPRPLYKMASGGCKLAPLRFSATHPTADPPPSSVPAARGQLTRSVRRRSAWHLKPTRRRRRRLPRHAPPREHSPPLDSQRTANGHSRAVARQLPLAATPVSRYQRARSAQQDRRRFRAKPVGGRTRRPCASDPQRPQAAPLRCHSHVAARSRTRRRPRPR